jgi:hypothetical protein
MHLEPAVFTEEKLHFLRPLAAKLPIQPFTFDLIPGYGESVAELIAGRDEDQLERTGLGSGLHIKTEAFYRNHLPGLHILEGTDDEYFRKIAENVANYHHERWDGSGYPEGLKGLEIPLEARIMAIADVYDALVSKRVYKDSMSFEQANQIIMEGMGRHFDARLEPYYVAARPRLEEFYRNLAE